MADDHVPDDDIPLDMTLESLLPSGLDLNDAQLLKYYRIAFGTVIARQNTMAKVTVSLRAKEKVREASQTKYEKIGYAAGLIVVGTATTLLAFCLEQAWPWISSLFGHKSS